MVKGPSLRQLKAERRRREILTAAARAFKTKGYHQTTMEDIAAVLLMTQGSLYYYFSSKEEILFACHLKSLEQLDSLLDRVRATEGSRAQKLRTLIEEPIRMSIDPLDGAAMALDLSVLSDESKTTLVELRDRYERGLRDLIRDGIGEGDFLPVNPRLTGFAVLGSINWTARWFDATGPMEIETVAVHFAELFLRGLGIDPSTVSPLTGLSPRT